MRNAAVSLVYLISVSLLWSAVADGADLGLAVRSGGSTTIQVAPDTPIAYEIVAELDTDADNEGLAYILFDLSFTGGALDQLSAPVGMSAFDIPDGITNPLPFGYGGAPQLDGSLAQVGGAQNTIKNTPAYADYPIGSVTTGIAWPGSPAVVAEGTLTAPSTPGFYTVAFDQPLAAVIAAGEDGSGIFWATDTAGIGSATSLTVEVLAGTIPMTSPIGQVTLALLVVVGGIAIVRRRRPVTVA